MPLLKAELRYLPSIEEKLWQQRSKLHWLKEGEQNTRYFHGKTSQRFRRNTVKRLRNSSGVWCEGDKQVANLFIQYFRQLFTISNLSQIDVLGSISRVVTESMNSELLRAFTRQEVDVALKQMTRLKALSPMAWPLFFISTIGAPLVMMYLVYCLNLES